MNKTISKWEDEIWSVFNSRYTLAAPDIREYIDKGRHRNWKRQAIKYKTLAFVSLPEIKSFLESSKVKGNIIYNSSDFLSYDQDVFRKGSITFL